MARRRSRHGLPRKKKVVAPVQEEAPVEVDTGKKSKKLKKGKADIEIDDTVPDYSEVMHFTASGNQERVTNRMGHFMTWYGVAYWVFIAALVGAAMWYYFTIVMPRRTGDAPRPTVAPTTDAPGETTAPGTPKPSGPLISDANKERMATGLKVLLVLLPLVALGFLAFMGRHFFFGRWTEFREDVVARGGDLGRRIRGGVDYAKAIDDARKAASVDRVMKARAKRAAKEARKKLEATLKREARAESKRVEAAAAQLAEIERKGKAAAAAMADKTRREALKETQRAADAARKFDKEQLAAKLAEDLRTAALRGKQDAEQARLRGVARANARRLAGNVRAPSEQPQWIPRD